MHVAGTAAQARTRDYVIAQMKAWGLETEVRSYDVWMPHPTEVRVWRVAPTRRRLNLAEPPVPGDPTSALPQYPTVNGYSGQGDVTGDVVYVNYGLIEDYAQLDSMGVSVRGKIAIARYGRSFRGIKAREAEKHGAVGVAHLQRSAGRRLRARRRLSRRADAPAGRRPARQRPERRRRSVDAGVPEHAQRAAAAPRARWRSRTFPSCRSATATRRSCCADVRGVADAAELAGWACRSAITSARAGEGARRRARRSRDAPLKPIYDTFGIVRGSEFPDELVIIGGHRDGWGPGAADNVSGTVSVLEAARAVAEQVKAGMRRSARSSSRRGTPKSGD